VIFLSITIYPNPRNGRDGTPTPISILDVNHKLTDVSLLLILEHQKKKATMQSRHSEHSRGVNNNVPSRAVVYVGIVGLIFKIVKKNRQLE